MATAGGGYFTGRLFWGYWFPLIIYCLVMFIQSSYPTPESIPKIPFGDKVMHFFAYAIMGGLFYRALRVSCLRWSAGRIIFFSALFTTLYGVGDEIHQSFVASRTADGMDVAADFIGGIFGAVCFYRAAGLLKRPK